MAYIMLERSGYLSTYFLNFIIVFIERIKGWPGVPETALFQTEICFTGARNG